MKLGGYTIEDEVGRGGMGVVYRARSVSGEEVALKLLLKLDAERRARFERERRILGEFTARDGFVPLLEAGDAPEGPYLVMPLIAGGTLRQRLERGALGVDETVELGRKLARALARAHARGIVHRDLKPENVLFAGSGEPLVADLGLAKHFDRSTPGASRSVSLSLAGSAMGTIGYAAPELLGDARMAGPPADVFALGAILYECLAGSPAFAGTSGLEVASRAARGDFVPLARAAPATPSWLARVVERTLAPDPAGRYADGEALRHALAVPGAPRSRPVPVVALALALGAGGAFLVLRQGSPPPPQPLPVSGAAAPAEVDHAPRIEGRARLLESEGRHDWRVSAGSGCVALTPDGKCAICGDASGSTRLFDLATGHELRSFATSKERVDSLAISPSGTRVVVGQRGSENLSIFDLATGRRLLALEAHDGGDVRAVAWSSGGERILSAGGTHDRDGRRHMTYSLWDATTGELLKGLQPDREAVEPSGIAFLAEDRAISCDDRLVFWDLGRGVEERASPEGQFSSFPMKSSLAIGAERKRAIVCNRSGSVALVDLETRAVKDIAAWSGPGPPWAVATDARCSRIVVTGYEGFRVFDGSGEKLWEPAVPSASGCALSADGRRLVTVHADGVLRYWDVDQRRELSHNSGAAGVVTHIAPNGMVVVSRLGIRELETWRRGADRGTARIEIERPGIPQGTALSEDGSLLAVPVWASGKAPELVLFDAKTGTELRRRTLEDQMSHLKEYAILEAAFSLDGRVVVTVDAIGRVGFHATEDLERRSEDRVVADLRGSDASVQSLEHVALFETPGTWIASSMSAVYMTPADSFGARVTDKPAGTHPSPVTALSARNRYAISGDASGLVKLWISNRPADLGRHRAEVSALALSPDESLAATASRDGTIVLWSPARRAKVATIELPSDHATAVAFEGSQRLHAGTARGLVMTFVIEP